MKTRIATALAILTLSLSGLSAATAQQPQTLPAVEAAETTITASPAATLPALDAPTVTTTAATEPQPQTVTEPQPLPLPQPTESAVTSDPATVDPSPVTVDPVPSQPVTVAPTDPAAVEPQQPICQEDQPCWNCETMGNRICGAGIGESVDDFLTRVCNGPQLGDAYAGIMRNCYYQEARTLAPNNVYIGSGFEGIPSASYLIPSQRYAGIIHSYTE